MSARKIHGLANRSILFNEHILPYIGKTNLDFGCGNGMGTRIMALHKPESHFVGYDIDPDKISQARILLNGSSVSNLEILNAQADLQGLQFPSVTANFVYHEHLELMKDLYTLISSGGKVLVLDYDLKGISRRDFLKRFSCDNERKVLIREGPENCYQKHTSKGLSDCVEAIRGVGFTVKESQSRGGYFVLVGVKN